MTRKRGTQFLENRRTGHDHQCDDTWSDLTNGENVMGKNIYKLSADVVFAYNIFSGDTQRNLNFTVTADICRDNFSDAVAAFKTYVGNIAHDAIALSIPDLVEKRVEGILSISYECEQEGYFENDPNLCGPVSYVVHVVET